MPKRLSETIAAILIWGSAVLVTGVFVWLVGDLLYNGAATLSPTFLIEEPQNAGRDGGIGPILVSTSLIVSVAIAVSLPIGLGTSILLAEFTSQKSVLGRFVRRSLDVLAAVPSIVFGLFGNVFFCKLLGLGFSILSGGLTLALMILPILIRATEEGFRSVPDDLRKSAAALGLSRTTTLIEVLLPVAMPGLIVGIVLGMGRAIAETAALIFTSGYVDRMPESLLDSGRALSIHIFDLSMNVSGGDQSAYASALVLLSVLLAMNWCAGAIAARWLRGRTLAR